MADILYNVINEYKAESQRKADPDFPVFFVTTKLETITGMEDAPEYHCDAFPIENRPDGLQDASALGRYLGDMKDRPALQRLSNFHFLLYLALRSEIFSLEEGLPEICQAVRNRDASAAEACCRSDLWTELMAKGLDVVPMATSPPSSAVGGVGGGSWPCPQCTYANPGSVTQCAMCAAARPAVSAPPAPAAVSSAPGASWDCKMCTYVNTGSTAECSMCGLPPK
mmetsp:Transcript_33821/g.77304  ORF Transcript_33821/g.77304 Transcript_33821/m.77304 type:complete len:225 (+) Transcript_33821:2-676(+)